MPLIIISGYPCCGKTTFAKALTERLKSSNLDLIIKPPKPLKDTKPIRSTKPKNKKKADTVDDAGNVEDDDDVHDNDELPVLSIKQQNMKQSTSSTTENESHSHDIFIINEESESIKKSEAYMFSSQEKTTRGVIKSAVGQQLNAHNIIICDSLNYIKGYRYELFCISKTFRTPHCVVWVEADEQLSLKWNAQRSAEDRYEEATMLDLRRRYEMPTEKNRWDSPLFRVNMTPANIIATTTLSELAASAVIATDDIPATVVEETVKPKKSSWKPKSKPATVSQDQPDIVSSATSSNQSIDDHNITKDGALSFSGSYVPTSSSLSSTSSEETIDSIIDQIINYFCNADAPLPNASTMPIYHGTADILFQLDQTSKEITDMIINHQINASEGTPIMLVDYNRSLALHRRVAIPELQRHRRQFIKVNSTHPPATTQLIGEAYIDFLALQI